MDTKECIICFENENVYTIDEISLKQPLLKKCECVFNTHENCIAIWIRNNPSCPYCKQQLYLEHIIKDECVINVEPEDTQVIYVTAENIRGNLFCIRMFLTSIFVITLFAVLINIS
jgi:hypothetical protein